MLLHRQSCISVRWRLQWLQCNQEKSMMQMLPLHYLHAHMNRVRSMKLPWTVSLHPFANQSGHLRLYDQIQFGIYLLISNLLYIMIGEVQYALMKLLLAVLIVCNSNCIPTVQPHICAGACDIIERQMTYFQSFEVSADHKLRLLRWSDMAWDELQTAFRSAPVKAVLCGGCTGYTVACCTKGESRAEQRAVSDLAHQTFWCDWQRVHIALQKIVQRASPCGPW